MSRVPPKLPPRDQIADDTPLRLDVAAALAYPDGSMTASGFRREAARGRLVIERTAGKDYTTRAAIREMRRLCQLSVRTQGFGCGQPAETSRGASSPVRLILSSTVGAITCFAGEADRAERKLAEYIAKKYQATRKERDLEAIDLADVLSIYVDDCAPTGERNRKKFDERIGRLNDFWGSKRLSEVNAASCRAYAEHRGTQGGARRDLEDLRAAINHHADEGLHRQIVKVTLPPKGLSRERWLTRSEAARLLWTCWRHREMQLRHRGPDKGRRLPTDRYPLRHLARFILIGLYTGTRAGAISSASPERGEGRSFVDLERGIFYRLAEGVRPTKKRQPPAPIPARLLAHMRRWHAKGIVKEHFVEWNGAPVASVKTALKTAVELTKLPGKVTPHTLRHTAATWLMQNGVSMWRVAGFLGMSVETLDRVYGHHHPDYFFDAAEAIGRKPNRNQALVVPLVDDRAQAKKRR